MPAAETARLIAELGFRDKFTPGVNKALGSVQKLDSGISRIGRGAGQLSGGLTRAGTIVAGTVAAGFAGAAKAAIDFEDAFAGVRKTVGDASDEELDTLALDLRKMATEIPIAATEFARLGETAGALGIHAKDIDEFVRTTALLGVTTDLTADAAAEALGKIGNVMGLTADEYDNFGSALVNLGNKGASTESEIIEITKRFAGAGKQAGFTAQEILGLAEAAASFTGLAPEAAGSSLSRLAGQLTKVVAGGGEKFKTLNKIAGTDFRKALDKDASGALLRFIKGLKKLDKYERASALKELGLGSVYLNQLITGLTDNVDGLTTSLANADEGWAGNFLNQEAAKKFDTVRSKLNLLRNGLIEAGITIGEGFTPALGRAAQKLSVFLAQDANRSELKKIGEDIGKAIDAIDWQEVLKGAREFVGIMRTAFDWAKRLYDVFNALPTEIKGATVGLLALNKLSGGLVGAGLGNIVGGLGETITRSLGSQLPGALGKAFVQPVFVTNMPVGGLGGGVGAAAGGGLSALSKVFLVGEAIGLAVAVNEVRMEIGRGATKYATAIQDQTGKFIASQPPREQLVSALAGVQTGIRDLQSNPLNVLVQGDALDKLRSMETQLQGALRSKETTSGGIHYASDSYGKAFAGIVARYAKNTGGKTPTDKQVIATLNKNRERQAAADRVAATKANEIKAQAQRTAAAVRDADLSIDLAKNATVSRIGTASASNAATISAAIRANKPSISTNVKVYVTAGSVQKSTTTQSRYGPANGSYGGGVKQPGQGAS